MRPVVPEFRERKGWDVGVEGGEGDEDEDEDGDDVGLGIDADDDAGVDLDAGVDIDVDVDVFSFVPVDLEPVASLLSFSTTLGGNSIGSPLKVLNVGLGTLAALPRIPVVFPAPVPAPARAPGVIDPEADPELVSSLLLLL